MSNFSYSDLMALDLTKLGTAASDWRKMADDLAELATDARDGLTKKSDRARWKGVNAAVTKDFVRKTAKEFKDLQTEAESVANVLADAYSGPASGARRRQPRRTHGPGPRATAVPSDRHDGLTGKTAALFPQRRPHRRTEGLVPSDALGCTAVGTLSGVLCAPCAPLRGGL
ncbi:hypothetical protein GCM10009535_42480 [Streptomyces thermocarboxydovorans]|uniref:WXG100 family type VII secretion target n=1 Tax=Streptomyces thermocarboxydovorans TaxID=59298 RepID=A0ABN1HM26_9ACTN